MQTSKLKDLFLISVAFCVFSSSEICFDALGTFTNILLIIRGKRNNLKMRDNFVLECNFEMDFLIIKSGISGKFVRQTSL